MNRRTFLLSALALPVISYGGVATAKARWQHFGADKAYSSSAAAIKDAAKVFRRAGWPEAAVAAMVTAMQKPGERYVLVNGNRLDFMRTGPSGLWLDVLVDFKERPAQNMEFAAPAQRWVITIDEEVFEAILPDVCNNLSGRRTKHIKARLGCAYVLFQAKEDDGYAVVHVLGPQQKEGECRISVSGPAPNGGRDFTGSFRGLVDELPTRCPTDWIPDAYGLPGLQVGSFKVSPGWWAVKVPVALADNPGNRVVVCLVKKSGESTYAMGVQHFDYYLHEATGRKIATIWYSKPEIPLNYQDRTGLWWRWSDRADMCRAGY